MKLTLHFILLNSEFSQGIADDFYDGEESEDNIKYTWEDELEVTDPVKEFKIRNNTTFQLQGFYSSDEPFSFEIPSMTVVDCITETGSLQQFAISKKVLKKTDKQVNEKTDEVHLFFYLRDTIPMKNPIDGIYISEEDFPDQLK